MENKARSSINRAVTKVKSVFRFQGADEEEGSLVILLVKQKVETNLCQSLNKYFDYCRKIHLLDWLLIRYFGMLYRVMHKHEYTPKCINTYTYN